MGLDDNLSYQRLRKKLTLDPLELDQELIELPMLVMEAAEEAAEALSKRDRAKNGLDIAMAVAADHLRREPILDAKGGVKTRSEAQIATEVALYESVQNAQEDVEDTKLNLALWQALVNALQTKRDSLKKYSDLTLAGFLSPNAALDQRRTDIRAASEATPRRRRINP